VSQGRSVDAIVVACLACYEAAFVTAAVLDISGGAVAKL
jgi:hypothetical protein